MPVKSNKLLMVQPNLQPPGGGNGVCAWMLEALKDEYDISVLSWQPVDLASINYYYGTSLTSADMAFYTVNPVLRRLVECIPTPVSLLKWALHLRSCRKIQHNFDILLTCNNEADFGRKGIQYIHFPCLYFPRPKSDLRWYHSIPFSVSLYRNLSYALIPFSSERVKQNISLVNSNWIAAMVKERYNGIETTTLYPPIAGDFPDTNWPDRENGFVCIGRISPEKEIEKIIDIIRRLRAATGDVHLHIIGSPDNPAYYARIAEIVRQNSSWISIEHDLPRNALISLVSSHRYGIHGMTDEHFGMAVAEMVRGSCIVFVPNSGGQTEIIGDCERLSYSSVEDAVAKISYVLENPDEQAELRAYLAPRRDLFTVEQFISKIRAVVREFAEK
jgi:glycosyltransferase involved in cell wall biosynthesis